MVSSKQNKVYKNPLSFQHTATQPKFTRSNCQITGLMHLYVECHYGFKNPRFLVGTIRYLPCGQAVSCQVFFNFHQIRMNKIFRAYKKRKITAVLQRHFLQFSKIGDKDKELSQKMLFVQQI